MRLPLGLALVLLAHSALAEEVRVAPGAGTLQMAISRSLPGDVLELSPGTYPGPFVIDRSVTLQGVPGVILDGLGQGTVVTLTGDDIILRGLEITRSGGRGDTMDAGVKIVKGADRNVVEANRIIDNYHGVDVHGCTDCVVRGNVIEGRQTDRMNQRGNGVYVWHAPGLVVEGNDIRWGRDGIFSNTSDHDTYRNNLFRDLRFAIHYMYTRDSEISGNISIGNHLGFAIMFSNNLIVKDNMSLGDRDHGLMINASNHSDFAGNLVMGAAKCTFIYDANKNLFVGNRFEGCDIGIHFTAGSEGNAMTGNAFIGNRTQVKYVGSRHIEWSFDGRGNFWSDHPVFDLNGDGFADSPFHPNDLMDSILWSQPAAALLMGSPAVQLIRWSQSSFPAILPGGVVDSHPLVTAPVIEIPAKIATLQALVVGRWLKEPSHDADTDAAMSD
ncbi:MAG: nitrous oxide reductase family maturation protein NosD [Candidatus Saccharibacteria bacterium]|nr:nitrous oxide reductase family maturation protein NosD [Pseudorhodobacter sp.]